MRSSMVRSLLQSGIQCYKNVSSCWTMSGFINNQQTRFINAASSTTHANLPSSTDEHRELMAVWPDVVRDLTATGPHLDIPEAMKWVAKVLQYNVPNSEKYRSLTLITAYRMLAHPEQLTDENLRLVRILAWCHELNQTFYLMEDDIIDRAQIRRGQPCWYLHKNIGLTAINDGIVVDQVMYQLLKMYFRNKKCYLDLVETFHDITLRIILGQSLDIIASNWTDKPNLNLFTMDRYEAIARYKAAYYPFMTPVTLAMYFAGVTDLKMTDQLKKLLLKMGHLYMVQDDYLDCYGDLSAVGDISSDISEGKCTWLIVKALQRANPSQRKILQECYGCDDPEKMAHVKQLYDDLELPAVYANFENENYDLICTEIQQICGFPHELLFKFFSMMYHRDR